MMRHAAIAVVLVACSPPSSDFAAPDRVTAVLTGGDVDLTWRHTASADGGIWIEMATPGETFVPLDAVWPDTRTYRHSRVAPSTTFLYRLRPFFGSVSNLVSVTTGPRAVDESLPEGPLDEPAASPSAVVSMRSRATMAAAAPRDLRARLASPTSVELRWSDRAGDEDGYLVELSNDQREFVIGALLPPGATSFRKIQLDPGTTWWFRVRPFFYGASSSVVSVTTGAVTAARETPPHARAQRP